MGVNKVFLRTPYNYDRDEVSNESGLLCADESRAVQSAKETCDINTIVRRFGVGVAASASRVPPTYADFTEVDDFKTAMDAVAVAREKFDAFPASLRAEFQNDPQRMIEFVSDSKNRDKAIELGLVPRPEPVAPAPPAPAPAS